MLPVCSLSDSQFFLFIVLKIYQSLKFSKEHLLDLLILSLSSISLISSLLCFHTLLNLDLTCSYPSFLCLKFGLLVLGHYLF